MKIVLFSDSLTSGGAQRQLTFLARILKGKGYEVDVLVYYDKGFFREILEAEPAIPVHLLKWSGQLDRIIKVWKFMRSKKPEVVISFLHVPNFLSSLIRLLGGGYRLIVSERNNDLLAPSLRAKCRFWMHRIADNVVPNSHAQAAYLNKHAAYLNPKIRVISNCVDLKLFVPSIDAAKEINCDSIKVVVVARIEEQKNGVRLAQALAEYEKTRGHLPRMEVDWYGRENHAAQGVRSAIEEQLRSCGHLDGIRFHDPVKNVQSVYVSADLLCLPSLHEGCANVICEAMAFGLPILASDAGDNAYLVEDGTNGFIFEGLNVSTIVEALKRFAAMDVDSRLEFGRASRARAETMLSKERFLREWCELIEEVVT
ncbi:MAG: glycosyltransferase family 4 protein [Verrucomicrobiota bacterium]|nr:glycosyltransferase family 4 protein [Verrucomicrobiota bacterium]MEC8650123.1 glycosyltransferase family 4 protein [Verrucomicrobiota bacterium]